ncbi:hypothetical protein [Candidatus Deianiraea vastatrix]|uniref:Uncharacterized protein n=1 Tax=Candidatus Deianiraea vastatrix TaxID=2163644 RepID=A0A5B8XE58_9RICK|nr:hypothetical protein [Candidatus Deianiraea vastatrix]QED23598.1 hypothetical protein Deia_00810 [Candidatus Deianiraea vastatrix]
MSRFFVYIVLILFSSDIAFSDERVDIDKYINSLGSGDKNEEIARKVKYGKVDKLIDDDSFIDKDGKSKKIKDGSKSKKKEDQMSRKDANFTYLQSISYGGKENWSIILNNISIDSSMRRNVNDLFEIAEVEAGHVKLKVLSNTNALAGSKDKRVIEVKNGENTDYYVILRTNEYINMDTYAISSGNMINNLDAVAR